MHDAAVRKDDAMQHLVRYTTPSGQTEHREVPSLEAAAELVEQARNELGATDAKIFREVPIEFKVQYKVTVAGEGAGSPSAAPSTAPASPPAAPSASASEPPPGAMPLSARPAGSEAEAAAAPAPVAEGEDTPENVTSISGDSSRRTLFGRS